jgi:hypothetical protein
MRTTYASVAVGITILLLGVVGALAGLPVGVVFAILAIGAARLATARNHAVTISPDASADMVDPSTERHHQGSHADGYHGAAMHHGGGGHGAGHGGGHAGH